MIKLAAGTYNESVSITKPIHLIGSDNVILTSSTQAPIISIEANDVTIENVSFDYKSEAEASTAILVNGNNNTLKNLEINTSQFGIRLDDAHDNELSKIKIIGKKSNPISERQHGIDLWKSDNNKIFETKIKHIRDGMYIESSNHTQVYDNDISHGRYGYHLMFTEDTVLEKNKSSVNVSGMMVMGTKRTKVNENILINNQKSVQSLGLLLFDVKDGIITRNKILNNRVGIFVESAKENDISMNEVGHNYIGLQFKLAENNKIKDNVFIANVAQGQAEDSSHNDINENYWGDHLGLDFTGNNRSDLPYEIDPFYYNLTDEYPPFQLLFASPGMIFLEQLFTTPKEEKMIDASPLMENKLAEAPTEKNDYLLILFSSLSLLFMSLIIIFMGVRT
ncbi:MAG TPA: NosD domain-containing protein [Pseudogracilibacillus sp.]|nr:NosD domain-containing protein [Pseudogracilibacillus sp.]